ncbi:DUF1186 domain-containing protein [uncultured Desulfobacter sp.]|uniref:HEAT repeat domain-containing protein n=1 Tax=uncultured Desulfobacter sp. TaxID=240139 RepID=UPI00259B5EF5|nr:DUF1186 domain-containing protein [uncultured Desulfobacter sp.]
MTYSKPIQKILQIGEPEDIYDWPDYLKYGFNNTHVRELIELLSSNDLWSHKDDKDAWAGVHAWRVLGQLKAEEAIEPLFNFLDRNNDEWSHNEIPIVLEMLGPSVFETSKVILKDSSRTVWVRVVAAEAMTNIAQSYPQYRKDSIHIFGEELKNYKTNDITLNSFVIYGLVHLQSHEYLKEMKEAFEARCVDEMIMGNWEDVQDELGV